MILIAGGRGFIGSNLTRLLDTHDIKYDVADLKDGVDVCKYPINGAAYDVIVLLAANLNHDMAMFQDNLRIYRWAIKQTAHFIYTSSAAVYGDNSLAHTEDDPTPARTLYGRSKLLGEQLIKQALSNYTIVRLSNVYGSGDGNGVIDIFKRGGNSIYGSGDDIRDYVDVKTVCSALKDIALDPKRYNKETFNISSSKGKSTNEIFAEFGTGPAKHLPSRGFDVKHSVLDNAKAKKAGLCV